DCDGEVAYADADGDDVAACEDCDDDDATVYPGAEEVCDGVDNDCDDRIDVDAVDARTWYVDADGDTFGASDGATVLACEAPEGYAAVGGDCDDDDPAIHPDALEVCDGIDNDCADVVDAEDATDR